MKSLLKNLINNILLEYKKQDLDIIKEYSEDFTFSFEIEVESKSELNPMNLTKVKSYFVFKEKFNSSFANLILFNKIIGQINNNLVINFLKQSIGELKLKELSNIIKEISFENMKDKNIKQLCEKIFLIYDILGMIENEMKYNNERFLKTFGFNKQVINFIIESYYECDDFIMKDFNEDPKLKKQEDIYKQVCNLYLPNFMKKWKNEINIKAEPSLGLGFEIILNTYIQGYKKATEFLDDFFEDFSKQENLFFNEDTGLHVNIGFKNEEIKNWNLLKGVLFLNYEFATKQFEERRKSEYVLDIDYLDLLKRKIKYEKNDQARNIELTIFDIIKNYIKTNNINDFYIIEKWFNDKIIMTSDKNWGMNILHEKWIEFRYPGGVISLHQIIESINYYMYIVLLCTNEEFKRQEYIKRLYKFIYRIYQSFNNK